MKKKLPFRNNKEIKLYNMNCIASFRNSLNGEEIEVPLSSISLTESVHRNAKGNLRGCAKYYRKTGKRVAQSLMVRKTADGYALLTGWKHYKLAQELGQERVNVIIVNVKSRGKLLSSLGCQKEYTICKMNKLKVPAKFDATIVNPQKLEAIKEYDYKYHAPMKPITVDKDMLIVDGYAQYVYNRNMGKEYCEVKIVG